MLALGFSSGLPFLLTGATLGYWLRDEGTSLTAIGFISWVGLAYSFKFLWAPLIDRTSPPFVGFLGRRRSWMLLAQIVVGAGLVAMAAFGTSKGLVLLGALALFVAFASATQDIVIDAWRIESAANDEEQGLLTSAYQLGYRIALLATDALILIAANYVGWAMSYAVYGAAMSIGIAATLVRAGTQARRRRDRMPLEESAARIAARYFRCHRRTVHRVLPRPWLVRASDAGRDCALSIALFRHGPDGQSVLPRHRPIQGLCRRSARHGGSHRIVRRHCRGRRLRRALRHAARADRRRRGSRHRDSSLRHARASESRTISFSQL